MTATKVFYSNSSKGHRAQIIVDAKDRRVTLAKFDNRNRRIKLAQPVFSTESLAREWANKCHKVLIGEGFKIIDKK